MRRASVGPLLLVGRSSAGQRSSRMQRPCGYAASGVTAAPAAGHEKEPPFLRNAGEVTFIPPVIAGMNKRHHCAAARRRRGSSAAGHTDPAPAARQQQQLVLRTARVVQVVNQ